MQRFLVVLVLCGCGGGGGGISFDDYPKAARDARCSYLVRCGLFPDAATCDAFFGFVDDPNLKAAIDAGNTNYDGGAAKECIDAFAAASCDGTVKDGRELSPSCDQILKGTGAKGDSCASSSECASNACNVPTCQMACCLGTCGPANPPAQLSQPCATRRCDAGLYCDPTAKICGNLLTAGASCTASDECDYGLGCAGTPQTCKSLPKLHEACPDGLCTDVGATCVQGTCVAVGLPGASCMTESDCSTYFTCDATMHCAPYPTRGQPCDLVCSDDSWCNIPSGTTMGTCDAPQANGMPCTFNDACTSHFCDDSSGTGTCIDAPVCI